MKIALVNPPWSFEGSIYFGCREPHLPLEFGYAKALLETHGHEVLLVDAQLAFVWRSGSEAAWCARKGEQSTKQPHEQNAAGGRQGFRNRPGRDEDPGADHIAGNQHDR